MRKCLNKDHCCPRCAGKQIGWSERSNRYSCYSCRHVFKLEEAGVKGNRQVPVGRAKSSGSGQKGLGWYQATWKPLKRDPDAFRRLCEGTR